MTGLDISHKFLLDRRVTERYSYESNLMIRVYSNIIIIKYTNTCLQYL